MYHARASYCLALAFLGLGGPTVADDAAVAKASPPARASLLGTRWDFSDGSLAGWRHKDNATLSLAEEEGKKVLCLRSAFARQSFTWAMRSFEPRSLDGVAHVRFRVRGDGSGHALEVHLGAEGGSGGRSLYYINHRQRVILDFTGWRTVELDLERFQTPAGGRRERDFARIHFIEFTVQASKADPPVEVRLDAIELVGRSAEELAQIERNRHERDRWAAELSRALGPIHSALAGQREALARAAAEGKYVREAEAYWAALDWCARDLKRRLEAEEVEIVRGTEPLLAALAQHIQQPGAVLARVRDRAPVEEDRLQVGRNPFFDLLAQVANRHARAERWWPKGRAGYRAVENPWAFRQFGDDAATIVWALVRPRSPMRHNPMLMANALNLFDVVSAQHTDGDFNVDRTAVHGHDPNINRFCLAPTLDAWHELHQAYPNLLPEAWRADFEARFRVLVEHQVSEYGLARLAVRPDRAAPAYPNMDVHYLLTMELAYRLWKDPRYLRERDGFLPIVSSAVYPMGAFAYVNAQNECFVYHQLDVVYLARLWQLNGDPGILEILRKTIPYYPYNVEPAGMPEYYTDPAWKHYWGRGDMAGPAVIAALFDEGRNQRVYEIGSGVWGHERGHVGAIAGDLFQRVPSQPLPDAYVIHDANIEGPRGRYGRWSFAANGRNYGVGFQGKDTFVGCMLTDPARRPMPLDAALQVVTTEVRLNHRDNHWLGGRCHSAEEKLTTALGPDFGSLAVRYTVSRPHWEFQRDELLPWRGTQQWYLSRTRLVGLVSLEALADESRAAVHGRIRLGLKRELVRQPDGIWHYGGLRIKIHTHNYARIEGRPSETSFLEQPSEYRSSEITLVDPLSAAAGEQGEVRFAKGSRWWFLVEVFRDDPAVAAAERVERIEAEGLMGFRMREAGNEVVVLHNPSEGVVEADLDRLELGAGTLVYRGGSGRGMAAGRSVRLGPQEHATLVAGRTLLQPRR